MGFLRSTYILFWGAIALLFAAANGCITGASANLPITTESMPEATVASSAFLTRIPGSPGTSENPIVIGADHTSDLDSALLVRMQKWAGRLENATGLSFLVRPSPPTELELLESMRAGKVGLAFLTPLAYAFGHKRGWVQPAASKVANWNGLDAGRIMFIARTDTGLQPGDPPQVLEQLKGRIPCYRKLYPELPVLAPLEEYILPSGLLALNSVITGAPILLGDNEDFRTVESGVFSKVCDFATVDALPPEQFRKLLPEGVPDFSRWAQEVQILYTTPPVNPMGVMAFSATLSQPLQSEITQAIVSVPGFDTETTDVKFNESLYSEFERIVGASDVDFREYLGVSLNSSEPTNSVYSQWMAPPMDTLVVDVPLDGCSPFLPFWDNQSLNRLVIPAIYAELARLDVDGSYFPYLAAKLPTWQNGLARLVGDGEDQQFEVEFRLRSNLTWQDEQPLTADDLVFSWNLVMDPEWQGSHWAQTGGYAPEIYIASVNSHGPDRVIYRFMSQHQAREVSQSGGRLGIPALYANLANQSGPVVPLNYMDVGRNVFPAHLLQNIPPNRIPSSDFAYRPIYAGAYQLAEGGETNKPVVLEAFDNFVLGRPSFERVVFGASYYSTKASIYWQSPNLLQESLQAGAIHAQLGLPGVITRHGEELTTYDTMTANALASINWTPRASWEVLDFNLDNPHLADLQVRQAIAHAIDRQAIIDKILGGHGELMRSYLPSWHPLYSGNTNLPDYVYDPDQARVLLQKAGYDLAKYPAMHPSRGALTLLLASMDVNIYPRPAIAAMIQDQLAKVGIEVTVEFFTWPEFEGQDCEAIRNGRKFDLGLAAWVGMDLYPNGWVQQVTAITSIPTAKNACPYEKSNWSGWRNPHADAIRVQLSDGRLALEYPDEYRLMWAEHQRLWATDLPSLPLFNDERPVVTAPQLLGVQPSPFSFYGVDDTWNIYEWVLK